MRYAQIMSRLTFTLILLFCTTVQAETVYKTVDENGNVIFTDKPSDNAEKIIIQDVQTIKNPNPATRRKPSNQNSNAANNPFNQGSPGFAGGSTSYTAFSIIEPASNEGYRSNSGNISVRLSLQPGLQLGHRVIIKLDGQTISSGTALSASASNVSRGAHTISANVVDGAGKSVISASSSFTLLRAATGGS